MLASRIVWFDAFVTNVDRTAKNVNLLVWHRELYLIDHGASLVFHHDWATAGPARSADPFARIRTHVLLPWASELEAVDAQMTALITPELVATLVAQIPESWLIEGGARRSRGLPGSPRAAARGFPPFRRGGPACTRSARMTMR